MKIGADTKLDFDDVLIVPQRTKTASRKNVDISRFFKFYHSKRVWHGTPIIAANMDTTGTFAMSKALAPFDMITCLHKHYEVRDLGNFFSDYDGDTGETTNPIERCWFSMGIKDKDILKLREVVDYSKVCPNICIDVANGYTDDFVNFCSSIRTWYPTSIIMAGNVCTPEMVQELILHGGVDIVKIGIGPGSACTTRLKTGVGFPQLSAIIDCAHAAHGLKSEEQRLGLICADGGCRTPADVCKAFAANADFVMLGGMLAGTDQCEGEWEYERSRNKRATKRSLKFYGMSSKTAQVKHGEGLKGYRSSEGRVKRVAYKGSAEDVVQDLLGGIRSSCSYMGATRLKDMAKCAEFIRVSRTHFDQSTGDSGV
jgi:GMP reductase